MNTIPSLNPNNLEVQKRLPRCPSYLCKRGRKEWQSVTQKLHEAGLLGLLDKTAIGLYCQTYIRWLDVSAEIQQEKAAQRKDKSKKDENPYIYAGRNTPAVSPTYKLYFELQKELLRLLRELGMTPKSRSKLLLKAKKEAKNDLFDDFVNSK